MVEVLERKHNRDRKALEAVKVILKLKPVLGEVDETSVDSTYDLVERTHLAVLKKNNCLFRYYLAFWPFCSPFGKRRRVLLYKHG